MDNSEPAVRNPDVKNSFFPATSHFVLILVEHFILVLIIFNSDEDFLNKYGRDHAITMSYVPVILWLLAAATMIIYYRFFNKAQIFQNRLGPKFNSCCCDVTWHPFKINKCCTCSTGCNSCSYVGLVCCEVKSVDPCDCTDCIPEESISLTIKQTEVYSNGANGIEMVRRCNGTNGANGANGYDPMHNGAAVYFNRENNEVLVNMNRETIV